MKLYQTICLALFMGLMIIPLDSHAQDNCHTSERVEQFKICPIEDMLYAPSLLVTSPAFEFGFMHAKSGLVLGVITEPYSVPLDVFLPMIRDQITQLLRLDITLDIPSSLAGHSAHILGYKGTIKDIPISYKNHIFSLTDGMVQMSFWAMGGLTKKHYAIIDEWLTTIEIAPSEYAIDPDKWIDDEFLQD